MNVLRGTPLILLFALALQAQPNSFGIDNNRVQTSGSLYRECIPMMELAAEARSVLDNFETLYVIPKQKKLVELRKLLSIEIDRPSQLKRESNQLVKRNMELDTEIVQLTQKSDNARIRAEKLLEESALLENEGKPAAAKEKRKRAIEVSREADQFDKKATTLQNRVERNRGEIEAKILEIQEIETSAPHVADLRAEISTIEIALADLSGERGKLEKKAKVTRQTVDQCRELVDLRNTYDDLAAAVQRAQQDGRCHLEDYQ